MKLFCSVWLMRKCEKTEEVGILELGFCLFF